MRNVTVTLDEDVARWVRIEAARHETSVSRWLGELVRERMRTENAYEAARRQFFSVKPRRLGPLGQSLPTREELHDRAGLR
jgi:hypothetical protein